METKQISKTNKMGKQTISKPKDMETTIFHNANKTASDVAKVHEVKSYIDLAVTVLTEGNISPKHAINALSNKYSDIEAEYLTAENQKLEAAANLLGGANALLDVAREKINLDAAKIIADLKVKINPLAWEMYRFFEYFEFADGAWSLKADYQKQIERLNSIILTDKSDIARYEKYQMLINLLNELKGEGASLQVLINNMVQFDHMKGIFSMKYQIFDTNNVVRGF